MAKNRKSNVERMAVAEVETLNDTFSISVKDDKKNVVYTNDAEPFTYEKVPSLQTAIEYFGGKLDDSQKQFLTEALSGGEDTGKAVLKIIETINDNLKADAKAAAYSKLFNEHKPVTEESIGNAHARMIRSVMKTANVNDETAHQRLSAGGFIPADYSLEMFRANKLKV